MQRLTVRSFPARNPFGDKIFAKIVMTVGETRGLSAASVNTQTIVFNSWPAWLSWGTSAPGLTEYMALFASYRITGVKLTTTVVNPNATGYAVIHNAGGFGSDIPIPTIDRIPEMRWAKYRILGTTGSNAGKVRLSTYYSMMKVNGGDRTIATDTQYVGTSSGSSFTAPANPSNIQYGFVTLDGVNATTSAPLQFITTATIYCTFFDRFAILS